MLGRPKHSVLDDEKSEIMSFSRDAIESLGVTDDYLSSETDGFYEPVAMSTFMLPSKADISADNPWSCGLLKDINRAATIHGVSFNGILEKKTASHSPLDLIREQLMEQGFEVDPKALALLRIAYSQAPSGFMLFLFHNQFSDLNRPLMLSNGSEVAIDIEFEGEKVFLKASASGMQLSSAEDPTKKYTITGKYEAVFELQTKGDQNGFQLLSLSTNSPAFADICEGKAKSLVNWNLSRETRWASEMTTMADELEKRKSIKAEGIRILATLLANQTTELRSPRQVLAQWMETWSQAASKPCHELIELLNQQEKVIGMAYGAFFATKTITAAAVEKIFPEKMISTFLEQENARRSGPILP